MTTIDPSSPFRLRISNSSSCPSSVIRFPVQPAFERGDGVAQAASGRSLLFGLQGGQNLRQSLVIALLAVPIVIQVYLNAGVTHTLNRALRLPHAVACQIVAGTPAAI